jgi:hypothetical protein
MKHTKNCLTTQDKGKSERKYSGGGYSDLSTMHVQV